MRRLLAIALAAALAACTEGPEGAPLGAPTPGPRPSADVTAERLTGTWVFGSRAEPGPGPVVACDPDQIMTLEQSGQMLSAGVSTCAGPCAVLESSEGSNQNGVVSLRGTFKGNLDPVPEPVSYELRYNAETQHLVGTRNGRPFWAAPLVKPSERECAQRDD